ncbi:MAG: hypothetical protein FJ284_02185 [Planctomycetes bacterium]|nr:hypothetical protein [Planctomycetota bacterium]
MVVSVAAAAMPAAQGYDSLGQVESASETKDYTQQVREKKFGDDQRIFVTDILLPQLVAPANRGNISRTRQRIRELALREAGKEVFDPINTLLGESMVRKAADNDVEPLIRVNAMLMVGELVAADNKPWPGAGKPLAAAASDGSLPSAVRIAALAGLARHVNAAVDGAGEAARPVVTSLLTSPPAGDPAARNWLVARALDLLPAIAPPPAAITAAAGILADEKAGVDHRVRAAIALGRLAKPDAGVDAEAALKQLRLLAGAALSADLTAAKERRFARTIGSREGLSNPGAPDSLTAPPPLDFGGAGFGSPASRETEAAPTLLVLEDEDAVPTLACRRNAWRLFSLAQAIKPARAGSGLVDLLTGDAAKEATEFGAVLREQALALGEQPDEDTLAKALAAIQNTAREPEPPAADPPARGRQTPADSPF